MSVAASNRMKYSRNKVLQMSVVPSFFLVWLLLLLLINNVCASSSLGIDNTCVCHQSPLTNPNATHVDIVMYLTRRDEIRHQHRREDNWRTRYWNACVNLAHLEQDVTAATLYEDGSDLAIFDIGTLPGSMFVFLGHDQVFEENVGLVHASHACSRLAQSAPRLLMQKFDK